jgi:hypothetical protein
MAIQTASGTIYVHSPDHPKRSRIIPPVAVFSVGNVCGEFLGGSPLETGSSVVSGIRVRIG